ncbi:centractin- actin- protein of the dynactin complex [Sorochytrium milnesiophthora]
MEFEDVLTNNPVVIDNVRATALRLFLSAPRFSGSRVGKGGVSRKPWTVTDHAYIDDVLHLQQGSGIIKAGFAGDTQPKSFFPSCVGRPKHLRAMAGAVEGDFFIGRKAQELRGLLKINYPMEHGVVTDWDDMERVWQYLYTEELKTLSEEHPVLLTEAPLNPKQNREQQAQILFETFNVPALFTSVQAVLALYASGRTTGLVMDSGDGVTHAVPVYEGFAIPHAIRRIDVAGRDVTEYLQMLLRKAGYPFHTSAEKEVVRIIKEKTCYVALNPAKEEKEASHAVSGVVPTGAASTRGPGDFVLPDGKVVKLTPDHKMGVERFRAPEILFSPDLVGLEYPGISQVVVDSINKTDLDLRKNLFGNVLLSGGSTLFQGFGDRLLSEMQKLANADTKIKIFAPPERKYSTWIGGSILANLSTFKKMWVSAEEYQEDPDIIHKKAF